MAAVGDELYMTGNNHRPACNCVLCIRMREKEQKKLNGPAPRKTDEVANRSQSPAIQEVGELGVNDGPKVTHVDKEGN